MQKTFALAISALVLVAGAAHAEVKIGGNNNQKVTVQNGAVANMAFGASTAKQNLAKTLQMVREFRKQNLASNKGNVKIGGNNTQEVSVKNGAVANMAFGASKAEQNLASNDGK